MVSITESMALPNNSLFSSNTRVNAMYSPMMPCEAGPGASLVMTLTRRSNALWESHTMSLANESSLGTSLRAPVYTTYSSGMGRSTALVWKALPFRSFKRRR